MNPSYIPPSPSAEPVSYAPQRRGGGGGRQQRRWPGCFPRLSEAEAAVARAPERARAPSGTTSSSAGAMETAATVVRSRPTAVREAIARQPVRPCIGRPASGLRRQRRRLSQLPATTGPYPYYGGYWGSGYGYGLGTSMTRSGARSATAATAVVRRLRLWRPLRRRLLRGGGAIRRLRLRGSHDTGSLRLKIKPREAQVYVDGYLVGNVDSFDGRFQKLGIESGGHRIELKADGYEHDPVRRAHHGRRNGHLQG